MYTKKQIADARAIYRKFASIKSFSLLTDPTSNPKTEKNSKLQGILTAPLHFIPGKLSGYQVCPMASPGCLAACLHSAGNPAYFAAKEKARLMRTRFFFEHRDLFLIILYAEITRHIKRAEKAGMFAGVRLNATSDIAWETIKLPNGKTLFEEFPAVTFYDYTAIPKRINKFMAGSLPDNYHLTFSAKENNEEQVLDVLRQGGTVAMAFNVKRGQPLPEWYKAFRVIDADVHDYRPADPKGCVAGLRAKGDAIGDDSGFVRKVGTFQGVSIEIAA